MTDVTCGSERPFVPHQQALHANLAARRARQPRRGSAEHHESIAVPRRAPQRLRGPAKITLMKPKVFRNVVPMSNTWQETWLTNSL